MIKKLIKESTVPQADEPKSTDYVRAIVSGRSVRVLFSKFVEYLNSEVEIITNKKTDVEASKNSNIFYLGAKAIYDFFTPQSRTITINGDTKDLTANRSWTVSTSDATKLPLDGSEPMTGDLEIAKTDPTIKLTSTYDDDYYAEIRRDATDRAFTIKNQVIKPDANGGALKFNGSNQYASRALDASTLTTFSVEMWIRIDSSATGTVFHWAPTAGSNAPFIYIFHNAGTLQYYINAGYNITKTSVSTNTWYHTVLTYDGSVWRLYFNAGTPITYTGGTSYKSTASNIYFGNGFGGYGTNTVDEAKIWDKCLTAEEITASYNSGNGVYGHEDANLIAAWHFDDASGSTASDYSGNGKDLTTYNSASWVLGIVGLEASINLVQVLSLQNGVEADEGGIVTLGSPNASYKTRVVIEGKTTRFNVGGVEVARIDEAGNFCLNTTAIGANADGVFSIGNGTAPSAAIANGIQLYAKDTSNNTSTLAMMLEQQVESVGTFTASHKIKILINGEEYWWQLDKV